MATEDQPTQAAEGGVKEPRAPGEIAMRDIGQARKLTKGADSIPTEAALLLGIANAHALLDLAAAIREHNSA
jgi:hypothetical protein